MLSTIGLYITKSTKPTWCHCNIVIAQYFMLKVLFLGIKLIIWAILVVLLGILEVLQGTPTSPNYILYLHYDTYFPNKSTFCSIRVHFGSINCREDLNTKSRIRGQRRTILYEGPLFLSKVIIHLPTSFHVITSHFVLFHIFDIFTQVFWNMKW